MNTRSKTVQNAEKTTTVPSEAETEKDSTVQTFRPAAKNPKNLKKVIQNLWSNPNFPGALSGIKTFNSSLKLIKHINVSDDVVSKALAEVPSFVNHLRPIRTFPLRRYAILNFGQVLQGDTAFEKEDSAGYKYFIVYQELFSLRLWTFPLKKLGAKEAAGTLEALLAAERGLKVETYQSDAGVEFTGKAFQDLLASKSIRFSVRVQRNKASYSESAVKILKNKLHRYLRSIESDDWRPALAAIVKATNDQPRPKLGMETPSSIKSPYDEERIRAAVEKYKLQITQKEREKLFPAFQDWKEMERNETSNAAKAKFRPGQFVVKDYRATGNMEKSYDLQRGEIFMVSEIISFELPIMYALTNLLGHNVKGHWYQPQLRLSAEDPTKKDFWTVSQIKKDRFNEKEKRQEYLVSYLHYSAAFDKWLGAESITEQSLQRYMKLKNRK